MLCGFHPDRGMLGFFLREMVSGQVGLERERVTTTMAERGVQVRVAGRRE
jgi:hypothetical protein